MSVAAAWEGKAVTLVLFDIDMTLVDSAGAGRQALTEAFHELYGVDQAFEGVAFQGRTDAALVEEALARHNLAGEVLDGSRDTFVDMYVGHLARALPERTGRVLPGARELLEALSRLPGVTVGLATGNYRRGAETKLSHFGLLGYVRQGGFGDDFAERVEVIEAAARCFGTSAAGTGTADKGAADAGAAEARAADTSDADTSAADTGAADTGAADAGAADTRPAETRAAMPDVVVVGDTAIEMSAAKSLGFTAIGVATGFDSADELRNAGADLVWDDLADTDAILAALAAQAVLGPPNDSQTDPSEAPSDARNGHASTDSRTDPSEAPSDARNGHASTDEDGAVEVEAKFAINDPSAIEELLARPDLAGSFALGPVRSARLMDTYYDTSDQTLLRRGLSLRVRTDGDRTRVTVKGLQNLGAGQVHRRLEQEVSLKPSHGDEMDVLDPVAWPEEMRATVTAVTGPEPALHPTCLVSHDRHYRDVFEPVAGQATTEQPAVTPLAEMCVEDVVVYRAPTDLSAGRIGEAVASYSELEIELSSGGSMQALETVAAWLSQQPSLEPVAESKLQRGLRLVASHPPGYPASLFGVQPDMPMAEAGRLVWRQQLVEMLLNEAGARQGADIEFVHDMRVSSRRARASGVLFQEWFKPRKIERFQTGLRTCGRRLGAVRDLDVALQKLDEHALTCPVEERKELKALAKHWRRKRRRAYVGLLDWLDSADYRRFVSKFQTFCSTPGTGAIGFDADGAPTPYQVRHVMPMAIFDRYVSVRAYETVLEGDAAMHVAESTLHALRIECKYLRYSLEMVRHLLGEDGEVIIEQLKGLQDHLGDFNDAVVAREDLRKMAKRGLGGPAVERYIDVQVDTASRLREEFPQVWQAFSEPSNREVLLRALSRL